MSYALHDADDVRGALGRALSATCLAARSGIDTWHRVSGAA